MMAAWAVEFTVGLSQFFIILRLQTHTDIIFAFKEREYDARKRRRRGKRLKSFGMRGRGLGLVSWPLTCCMFTSAASLCPKAQGRSAVRWQNTATKWKERMIRGLWSQVRSLWALEFGEFTRPVKQNVNYHYRNCNFHNFQTKHLTLYKQMTWGSLFTFVNLEITGVITLMLLTCCLLPHTHITRCSHTVPHTHYLCVRNILTSAGGKPRGRKATNWNFSVITHTEAHR